eukprot:3380531-Prymnesium_polylepis.1
MLKLCAARSRKCFKNCAQRCPRRPRSIRSTRHPSLIRVPRHVLNRMTSAVIGKKRRAVHD